MMYPSCFVDRPSSSAHAGPARRVMDMSTDAVPVTMLTPISMVTEVPPYGDTPHLSLISSVGPQEQQQHGQSWLQQQQQQLQQSFQDQQDPRHSGQDQRHLAPTLSLHLHQSPPQPSRRQPRQGRSGSDAGRSCSGRSNSPGGDSPSSGKLRAAEQHVRGTPRLSSVHLHGMAMRRAHAARPQYDESPAVPREEATPATLAASSAEAPTRPPLPSEDISCISAVPLSPPSRPRSSGRPRPWPPPSACSERGAREPDNCGATRGGPDGVSQAWPPCRRKPGLFEPCGPQPRDSAGLSYGASCDGHGSSSAATPRQGQAACSTRLGPPGVPQLGGRSPRMPPKHAVSGDAAPEPVDAQACTQEPPAASAGIVSAGPSAPCRRGSGSGAGPLPQPAGSGSPAKADMADAGAGMAWAHQGPRPMVEQAVECSRTAAGSAARAPKSVPADSQPSYPPGSFSAALGSGGRGSISHAAQVSCSGAGKVPRGQCVPRVPHETADAEGDGCSIEGMATTAGGPWSERCTSHLDSTYDGRLTSDPIDGPSSLWDQRQTRVNHVCDITQAPGRPSMPPAADSEFSPSCGSALSSSIACACGVSQHRARSLSLAHVARQRMSMPLPMKIAAAPEHVSPANQAHMLEELRAWRQYLRMCDAEAGHLEQALAVTVGGTDGRAAAVAAGASVCMDARGGRSARRHDARQCPPTPAPAQWSQSRCETVPMHAPLLCNQ